MYRVKKVVAWFPTQTQLCFFSKQGMKTADLRVTFQVLLRDFGLLEEVDAAVDRADRDLRIRDEDLKGTGWNSAERQIDLER